jgi:hypothetical protein
MKPLKTKDLHPCDSCGGSLMPIFYRLNISFRQLMINTAAANEVLGTSQILGGNLFLGSMMSPDRDVTIELPGYQIDKDLFICQSCAMGLRGEPFTVRPLDWMIESENEEAPNEL